MNRSGPRQQVLVMRQRRKTVTPSPFRQVSALNAQDLKAVVESSGGLRVGGPLGPIPLPRRASDARPLGVPGGH